MIFISYARQDAAAAQRLAAELAQAGVPSLRDPPLPQGDVFWRDRLAAQMARCSVMAALDSAAAAASPWVTQERLGFSGSGGVLHGDAKGDARLVDALVRAWRRQPVRGGGGGADDDAPGPGAVDDTGEDRVRRMQRDDHALARWRQAHPMTRHVPREAELAWLGDGAVALRAVPGAAGWYLALAPLTNAGYRRYLEASGRPPPATWDRPGYAAAEQPVTGMTWHEAAACAAWYGGELPPEAVWQAAAQAGLAASSATGASADGPVDGAAGRPPGGRGDGYATVDGGLCARRAHYGQPFGSGAPRVASDHPATPLGFVGLCGNTWDWCADAWSPADATAGVPVRRVLRGGGWMDSAAFCRIGARYRNAAIDPDATVGLRLAWRAQAGDTGSRRNSP